MESASAVAGSIVFLLEGLLIIFANIISLVIFVRKFRHLKTCMLLINLSFTDLMVGFFTVIQSILYLLTSLSSSSSGPKDQKCHNAFLTFGIVISNLVIMESLATLALVAVERAYAVIKPICHRVIKTKYYRLGIFFTWCISSVPVICFIVMRCGDPKLRDFTSLVLLNGLGLMYIFIMIISYTTIYVKLRFYPVFQQNASTQMQIGLCKTLFLATLASAIAYVPYCIFTFYNHTQTTSNGSTYLVVLLFACSNSFVNCFIYAWKMPAFRLELRKMCVFCQPQNNAVNTAGETPFRRNMTGCSNVSGQVVFEPTPVKDLMNQASHS